MALLHLQPSYFINKPHLFHKPHPYPPTKPKFTIFSQNSPQPSKPITTNDPITEQRANSTDKKPTPSSGQGFGSTQLTKPDTSPSSSGTKKGWRERDRIIRRSPVEKPAFLLDNKGGVEDSKVEPTLNESAFLLTWLGLGVLILFEGLALAASGFLPEEWDKLFVKYLYPSFTPTVFVFVAGTVTYGVYKYFQNENARNQN